MNLERPGDAEHTDPPPPNKPAELVLEDEDKQEDGLEVVVDNVVLSPHSNLKKSASKRRLVGVSFSEQPRIETFEIEEGNKLRKTPSAAKLKAMAGRWNDPFALSSSRKRIRVDEMEDTEEVKVSEPVSPQPSSPVVAASSSPTFDPASMTDQQLEAKFLEVVLEAWTKLSNSANPFKVEHMLGDMKASGLFDAIKTKHGAVRKWFTLHPELFGLSADGFISRTGYNEEFKAKVKDTLEAAPKQTMKLHQLTTDLKSQVSENGFRKAMKGYDTLVNYLAAHSNDFMLSKDKAFVALRRDLP